MRVWVRVRERVKGEGEERRRGGGHPSARSENPGTHYEIGPRFSLFVRFVLAALEHVHMRL